ncbi:hypothetical protein KL953_08620 [Mycolicibacterium goodii]|uniref:hypothetical protein n=1 Tax=Mycolicibacterium goodii TaxID=134601 RepID=UPI001BDD4AA6|nr:hypothetical protein [Mycolicibacterium goodii]MBU8808958.1 hypothetical protein [Mycolicibacterium goodii]
MTEASLTIEVDNDQDGVPEAEVTAYRLNPINAAAVGKPWTRIEVLPGSAVKPNGVPHGVRVSARWGWTNVPNAIKYATLLQAGRFYERRENVSGVLTRHKVDDIELGWSSGAVQDLDPDVLASTKPYARLWVAT